jgi:hypothetical protein
MAMKQPRLAALVGVFADSVAQQSHAKRRGDHRTGNKHAKRYIAAFAKLRANGDIGRDALVPLLSDARADVRQMAACFLLRYKTESALGILSDLAKGQGLIALGASQAIQRWTDRTWDLDPPDKKRDS